MGNIGICLLRRGSYSDAADMFDIQILNLMGIGQHHHELMANALVNKSLALHYL